LIEVPLSAPQRGPQRIRGILEGRLNVRRSVAALGFAIENGIGHGDWRQAERRIWRSVVQPASNRRPNALALDRKRFNLLEVI
jgi:hypothetical protein